MNRRRYNHKLTEFDKDSIREMAKGGLSNLEIARRLRIDEKMVRYYKNKEVNVKGDVIENLVRMKLTQDMKGALTGESVLSPKENKIVDDYVQLTKNHQVRAQFDHETLRTFYKETIIAMFVTTIDVLRDIKELKRSNDENKRKQLKQYIDTASSALGKMQLTMPNITRMFAEDIQVFKSLMSDLKKNMPELQDKINKESGMIKFYLPDNPRFRGDKK
jgi:hypothetical protein